MVIAPNELSKVELGEICAFSLEDTINKTLKLNLMTITKDPKKQNIRVILKIVECKNNQAFTIFHGYELQPSYIKKLTKKDKMKVEDSFIVKTKDGIKLRVKILLFTRLKTNHSYGTKIRNAIRSYMTKKAEEDMFTNIIGLLLNQSLHREIKNIANKIYPVNVVFIKAFMIEKQ